MPQLPVPEQFGNTTEREPVQYPGKNPFEIMKSQDVFPEEGVVFRLNFTHDQRGNAHVVSYKKLQESHLSQDGQEIRIDVDGARELYFSIENAEGLYKTMEPHDRGAAEYIPRSFDRLDQLPITNGGRVLLEKQSKKWGAGMIFGVQEIPEHFGVSEFSRVFDGKKLDELRVTIAGAVQEKVGLSQVDAEKIADEVVRRMEERGEKA